MSKEEPVIRYGDDCIVVVFPTSQPKAKFLVRGPLETSDVDVEGDIRGHPDVTYAYKAQARLVASVFAWKELMRISRKEKQE